MSKEIWKEIRYWSGYFVSDQGRYKPRTSKARTPFEKRKNHPSVINLKDGDTDRNRTVYFRTLVMETFTKKAVWNYKVINIDGDVNNNKLINLKWVTKEEWASLRRAKGNAGGKPTRRVRRSDGQVFETLADAARSVKGGGASIKRNCLGVGKKKTYKNFSWEFIDD